MATCLSVFLNNSLCASQIVLQPPPCVWAKMVAGNGEKSDHTCFKDGKENGPTILYNQEGKIWLKGQYSNGNKTGEWIFHDSDGSVTHKENF